MNETKSSMVTAHVKYQAATTKDISPLTTSYLQHSYSLLLLLKLLCIAGKLLKHNRANLPGYPGDPLWGYQALGRCSFTSAMAAALHA